MKVLQLIQRAQLRGAEIFAMQLSQELIRRGVIVDCVYLFEGTNELIAMFPTLTFRGLGGRPARRFFDFRSYRKLARWIREGKYDIVQANAGDTLKYASLSKLLHGFNALLVFRNANTMSGFIRSPLQKKFNEFLLRRCIHVISVSESCRRDLVALFPFFNERSSTITIGTYVPPQVPAIASPDEPVLINIGAFVREKNHAFLLEVFSAYYGKHRQGYLWLIGGGPLKESLQSLAAQLGILERISFLGYQPDVVSFLRQSSVMVMPSKIEGLPAVLLEAMANRVPVIASAVGGIPEVIQDGSNGSCLPGFDAMTYIERIEAVTENSVVRKNQTDAAFGVVSAKFQMEQISSAFHKKYTEILVSRE